MRATRHFLLLVGCTCAASSSATLYGQCSIVVPQGGFIQDAIDSVPAGGICEVLVPPGNWAGPGNVNLEFTGKRITLRASGARADTTIFLQEGEQLAVFEDGETAATVIQGFTIEGRHFDPDPNMLSHRGGGQKSESAGHRLERLPPANRPRLAVTRKGSVFEMTHEL